jgi:transcriptional regulator with XRE-family HTH domain
MTTPRKIRAARALLDLSQAQLAEMAGLSIPTVKRAESTTGTIVASGDAIKAITAALDKAGVLFLEDGDPSASGGEGVRLRKKGRK